MSGGALLCVALAIGLIGLIGIVILMGLGQSGGGE